MAIAVLSPPWSNLMTISGQIILGDGAGHSGFIRTTDEDFAD
jgi:hypothetical protein